MERVTYALLDSQGQPLPGVQVTVRVYGSATLAAIYTDREGGTAKANPFVNDANGTYEYYARTGYYTEEFVKDGATFEADDRTGFFVFDPTTTPAYYAAIGSDFLTAFVSSAQLVADGGLHLTTAGTVRLKTPTTTYKNGWLEVLGSGAVAGKVMQANHANAFVAPFVITADPIIFETRLERVTATTATIRVGLASADLSAGDPAHGFYLRQVDAANAFLVVRSGSADSGTVDLGFSIASARKIRIVARNAGVRAWIDDAPTTEVTASIPSSQMLGFSAAESVTTSGVGVALDYAHVWTRRI